LCGTDWLPYQNNFDRVAYSVRFGSDGAKISQNSAPLSSSDFWLRASRQGRTTTTAIALTDLASAVAYGIQVASLSRAGDDGASRVFIDATDASLQAGVASMRRDPASGILMPDATSASPDAYPLTTLTYAAVSPFSLDSAKRQAYASFLTFATGTGQSRGDALGQIPRGYLPLPASLKADADAAVAQILNPTAPTTTTSSTEAPVAPTTVASTSTTAATAIPTGTVPSVVQGRTVSPPTASVPSSAPVTVTAASVESTSVAPATSTTAAPATSLAPVPAPTTVYTSSTPARFAVPSIGALAVLSALGGLEMSTRPRRRRRRVVSEGRK
jgi:hypothetical protein